MRGKVKYWNNDRGFGFLIAPDGQELFMHISDFDDSIDIPMRGDEVEFDIGKGRDGRVAAKSVHRPALD